jgi:hypothetical protein
VNKDPMGNLKTEPAIEGVAIIGMSGRFPGAKNLSEFWRNLRDGVESVSFFSDEELESSGIEPSLFCDPHYVKAKALWMTPSHLTRHFLALIQERQKSSTLSTVFFWSVPGRRSKVRAMTRRHTKARSASMPA